MKLTKEEFKRLSNEDKLKCIQNLHAYYDRELILDLLLSGNIEELDSKLLSELGRAYNNNGKYEEAMAILDMVTEDKDAMWYYRYAYAHTELSKNYGRNFEEEARNAFEKFEIAVKISNDEKMRIWCFEFISMSRLEEILQNEKDNYPFLSEHYFEYRKQKNKKIEETIALAKAQKKKTYKKITIEDIQNIEESWDICEPLWFIINIYEGYEDYIKSAEIFTLEQRYLFAITWYFSEVNNGGHHQFFYNSTGIVWEDVLNGFKHFGMPEFAANFQKVIDYFGGTISFDREERYQMLETLEEKYGEEFFKILEEADDFVFEYEAEENELDYIKANPEKFVFEGEYEGF
ncbi:MAG: DMP19 family protein [Flavobacteriaceae bacterium]|nr:DMP19 family protein [Flavobacteriaceae bacterium]